MFKSVGRFGLPSVAFGAAVLSMTGPTLAHHSFAMFDFKQNVSLDGTIKDFQWTNPHSWIVVTVADASGKTTDWQVEGGSPNGLGRQGWKRNSLKAGEKAVVVIHPLKDGTTGGCLVSASVGGVQIGDPRDPS
jgi:hypothetical protein